MSWFEHVGQAPAGGAHCRLHVSSSSFSRDLRVEDLSSGAGFLSLGPADIWGQILLWCGGCPGHRGMRHPRLYPFDAVSPPSLPTVVMTKSVSIRFPGKIIPSLEPRV